MQPRWRWLGIWQVGSEHIPAFSLIATRARALMGFMKEFRLHDRLAAGSADLGRHGICRVLLKNQAHFLWIVLVPEVPETITELHHLSEDDYRAVTFSIRAFSAFVEESFAVDKINVASIGNQVRQLHIHVVGRKQDDIAWPGVVWACSEKLPYAPAEWTRRQTLIRKFLTKNQPTYGYC